METWINYKDFVVCPLAIYDFLQEECKRQHNLNIETYSEIKNCYIKSIDYSKSMPEIVFSLELNDMIFTFAKSMPEILIQEIKTANKKKIKNKWYYFIDTYKPTIIIDNKTRNLFLKQLNKIINDPDNKFRINKININTKIKEITSDNQKQIYEILKYYIGSYFPKSEKILTSQVRLLLTSLKFDNFNMPKIKFVCDSYGILNIYLNINNLPRLN